MATSITVNGRTHSVEAAADTPLLYVLRNDLELNGAKYGCGFAQCGACTVVIEGKPVRSCVTPVSAVAGKAITTIEGPGLQRALRIHCKKRSSKSRRRNAGYCANGMIMTAKIFLDKNPRPTEAQIKKALGANYCRCGTHNRIVRAVQRAAKEVA
jgi:nicotinate dehydrogenase subunit A